MFKNKKKKKNSIFSSVFFWMLFWFYVFWVIGWTFFGPVRNYGFSNKSIPRQKACYSNIRVIQGAVEMYNMDSEIMMNDLKIGVLRQGNYLKNDPILPENSCVYTGNELNNTGSVYCTYHGDIQGMTPGIYSNNQF